MKDNCEPGAFVPCTAPILVVHAAQVDRSIKAQYAGIATDLGRGFPMLGRDFQSHFSEGFYERDDLIA
jgi:hypothetical protein